MSEFSQSVEEYLKLDSIWSSGTLETKAEDEILCEMDYIWYYNLTDDEKKMLNTMVLKQRDNDNLHR